MGRTGAGYRGFGPCVLCKVRIARKVLGPTCDPCWTRVCAEGTAETLGLTDYRVEAARRGLEEYNNMLTSGMTRRQIAEKLGVSPATLSGMVARWAKRTGLKPVRTQKRLRPTKPKAPKEGRKAGRPVTTEHGGGRWGVAGCNCKLCIARRREARRVLNIGYRARVKAKKQALQQKEMPS